MRSTKLAVSSVCSLVVGITAAVLLGPTWLWITRNTAAFSPDLGSGLLRLWLALGAPLALIIAGLIWFASRRANKSVRELARILPQWKEDQTRAMTLPEQDCEYQQLLGELNDLVKALRDSQHRLDRYSAKVAHELRAPITLLQLQLDYAAKQLDPHFVETMALQIRRLTEYVDTALFIAKVADDKIRPAKSRRKIAELVREVVEPYELHIKAQGRKLSVKLSSDQEAEVNEKMFGLILNNLLSNALAHGLDEIRLHLRKNGDSAVLLVLNRVRTNWNSDGTGLGLRTVRILTQAHSGLAFRSRHVFNSYAAELRIVAAKSISIRLPHHDRATPRHEPA
jgi:signal transduction histidine kinase